MTTNAAYTTPSNILSIVESHMAFLISKVNSEHEQSMIVSALKILLNGSYTRYRFSNGELGLIKNLSNDSLQALLSSMNERSETRKERGVYYTPVDVTAFIVKTCFNKYLEASQERHASRESACKGLLFDATVFDPTCGSGEFIRDALKAKIRLLEKSRHSKTSGDFLNIVSTLSGNDLNPESVEITKIRIFFEVLPYIDKEYYAQLARTLNSNFHTHDFINCDHLVFGKKDIILGNPPYIEDRKSKIPLARRYGNIYANVLDECIGILKEGGIMGMIIPISYISTPRMEKIRQIIRSETDYEILLNYADRPSCLFTAVHQKLTILIARKGRGEHKVFTSGYRYWYVSEREQLFNDIRTIENRHTSEEYYPKIGDEIADNIYSKIACRNTPSLYEILGISGDCEIFINMRATFWIKAFSFNPGSKEYKKYRTSEEYAEFVLALINSSLFFWYWTVVSDGWHITSKEWRNFKLPVSTPNKDAFNHLCARLERDLEATKVFVGTVQTEYVYKHKLCKSTIDLIDDALAELYGLSIDETNYIKNYAAKYREAKGI